MEIAVFDIKYTRQWNAFVRESKNATFLFYREYMDYHADRFHDASLIIFDNSVPIALFPATLHDDRIISHGGLTYGGFLVAATMRLEKMLALFDALLGHFVSLGVKECVYKAIPHIYHRRPAEEDLYALFRLDARLLKREPSAALHLRHDKLPGKKGNGARRGAENGLRVEQIFRSDRLLALIDSNLSARHGVRAVHTATEMNMLRDNFPRNIEIFEVVTKEEFLVGGAIVYVTDRVAHVQYLVSSEEGKKLRSNDLIVSYLLERYRLSCDWFDFGISTEDGGRRLNSSLMSQKEEFGAFTVSYDSYLLSLT